MILDYCRENRVAIHFFSKEELDKICQLFSNYKEDINYNEGIVSFTRINASKNITWNYRCSEISFNSWYEDYIVLTAIEFFELADELSTIMEKINR